MNRFALIIESSNVKNQDDLPGARKDSSNWYHYLTSNAGGAWLRNEIIKITKPSLKEVSTYLTTHQQDYCFVAFSGHGYEMHFTNSSSTQGVPCVCLNDDEQNVRLSSLKPQGKYGTLISDSCRGYETSRLKQSFSTKTAGDLILSEENTNQLSILHRRLWFRALEQCCDAYSGVITMYSCSSGESADEDPNAGGLYTSLLISSSNNWYDDEAENYHYLTTLLVHDKAKTLMKKYAPQQTPEYYGAPRTFPFTVKMSL